MTKVLPGKNKILSLFPSTKKGRKSTFTWFFGQYFPKEISKVKHYLNKSAFALNYRYISLKSTKGIYAQVL